MRFTVFIYTSECLRHTHPGRETPPTLHLFRVGKKEGRVIDPPSGVDLWLVADDKAGVQFFD
jgi:hypothetical protein